MIKKKYIKQIYKDIRQSKLCAPVQKGAQVQRRKESWLTIRSDEDQDLVSYDDVWTSPHRLVSQSTML